MAVWYRLVEFGEAEKYIVAQSSKIQIHLSKFNEREAICHRSSVLGEKRQIWIFWVVMTFFKKNCFGFELGGYSDNIDHARAKSRIR